MYWMVCSVSYLGCIVVNIGALFAEWSITERDVTTSRYCCSGFFLAWNPLGIYFQIYLDALKVTFQVLVIFHQRQTCTTLALSADCSECFSSPNIRHFRLKLVHWNESVYCTPIDKALKMRFKEGSGNFLRPTIPELWRFLWNQLRRFLDKINTQI